MSSKRSHITHFFVEPDQIENNLCKFTREETDHIFRTLRLVPGDLIKVTDGIGNLYDVMLGPSAGRVGTSAEIVKVSRWGNEIAVEVTVAFGLTLQGKADDIIEQCTQLGVRAFVPLLTSKTLARLDEDKARARIQRWRKVAISAVKQSLRSYLPTISSPSDIRHLAMSCSDYDLVLIGSLQGKRLEYDEQFAAAKSILLITGPEQGFTLEEETTLTDAGARPVLLGDRRLRAELAPVVFTTLVLTRANIL
ncbi:MAG: 16S rRNA (uracil(1498)-N(3))-methyltransferase [Candidatus Zixiibacteriota bacterium]|nr:MAG: 16S rRNA (uracil(1498)-N(3))-methyltransferase [candidate division Zixibacteria bacterium]